MELLRESDKNIFEEMIGLFNFSCRLGMVGDVKTTWAVKGPGFEACEVNSGSLYD